MIGFASRFALHTLRRMVVLPAFALPMTRMRNWGHRRRISAGPKAPSLDGRTLLDDWLSADMGGEQECSEFEDQVVVEINQCGPYRKNRVSFSRQNQSSNAEWRSSFCLLPRAVPMYSHEKPENLRLPLICRRFDTPRSSTTLKIPPDNGRKAWLHSTTHESPII